MIGQAAIGNPRIFTSHQPNSHEKMETILRHLDISVACDQHFEKYVEQNTQGVFPICIPKEELEENIKKNLTNPNFESHTVIEFRKFLFQYIKGIPESREWKNSILNIKNYGEVRSRIIEFFEETRLSPL